MEAYDSGDSAYSNSWVSWFLSNKESSFFCEVDIEYIEDRFNLTGLNTEVDRFNQALHLITDVLGKLFIFKYIYIYIYNKKTYIYIYIYICVDNVPTSSPPQIHHRRQHSLIFYFFIFFKKFNPGILKFRRAVGNARYRKR